MTMPPPGVPIGSILDPVNNTWTDPAGQIWQQLTPDGAWTVCVFAFEIGVRVNAFLGQDIPFPATVTRHESCSGGIPFYGLTLDNGANASLIPETLLVALVTLPPVPPLPPVPATEFRNVVFTFVHQDDGRISSNGEIDSNAQGDVRIQVQGEYRGEATFIRGFIGADREDIFEGLEATSFITPIQAAQNFVGFGPLQTGNLGWPPWSFNPNSIFTLLARMAQVSVDGTELREVAAESALQIVTTDTQQRLSIDETELLVTDTDGTHPLLNPFGNIVHLSNFNFPWRFEQPVTNAGSLAEVVHFEVRCGFLQRVRAGVFRFVTTDTLIGPSMIVPAGSGFPTGPGPAVVISFDVSAQGFACSENSVWRVELRDARGGAGGASRVGSSHSFDLDIASPLAAGPLSADHRPAIVGARSSFGSHF